jgi:glycosyltransferase involved in cell wall biosynthesis
MYSSQGRRAILHALAHALGVWRVLRKEQFDVVDCQIPAHLATIAAKLACSAPTSLIVTWHEAWGRHWIKEMGLVGYLGRAVEREVARFPGVHVAVSEPLSEALATIGGLAAVTIPPGVDFAEINVETTDAGPGTDVLFVGRLVPTKNLGLLIKAIDLLVRDGKSPRVLVIGEGPAEGMWKDEVSQAGLAANFEFAEPVERWEGVLAALKSTRVLAFPSVREGFGMIALEAAACGVPVVTVDHPRNAARRFVEHEVTGLLVPNDPEALAVAIDKLLEDAGLRERLGNQARKKAMRFEWSAVVDQTLGAYSLGDSTDYPVSN